MNLSVSSTGEITDEEIMGFIATRKEYVFAYYMPGPAPIKDASARETHQTEHLRFLFNLKKSGKLALLGPLDEDDHGESFVRCIMIFNTADKEEVENLLVEDPLVQYGHFKFTALTFIGTPGDMLEGNRY